MESCVPPGFRFHPTDEELVGYYLKKKVAGQKIDVDVIRDIDLYRIEPWDLQEKCWIGYEEQSEWYLFSHKDKKYPTGTRTNRATMAGFWKATGRDKAVYEKSSSASTSTSTSSSRLIGMRKTLVFYKGRAPNGHKTDWIMHEYRLQSHHNAPLKEEGWVVCRAFKKKTSMQSKNNMESSYVFDEASGVIDPLSIIHNHTSKNSFFYPNKLEIESEALLLAANLMHPPSFLQLESPLFSNSLISQNNYGNIINTNNNNSDGARSDRMTDWRALDHFVASQLSQS